jgi:hypothetical protein
MRTDNSSKCVYGRDLYVISLVNTPYFKVGRATDCQKRLRQIQACSPFEARIVLQYAGAGNREAHMHKALMLHRLNGEWFDCTLADIMRSVSRLGLVEIPCKQLGSPFLLGLGSIVEPKVPA